MINNPLPLKVSAELEELVRKKQLLKAVTTALENEKEIFMQKIKELKEEYFKANPEEQKDLMKKGNDAYQVLEQKINGLLSITNL